MTKAELIHRLTDVEWEDFEVKRAQSELPKNIWSTISAFSNTAGGWLILGIEQKGKTYNITGVNNIEKLEQDFINTLRGDKFNVKIVPRCKRYTFNNKKVLAFYIPISNKKPIYYNSLSNTFIRTGSGDQKATNEETDAMFRDQAFGTRTTLLTEFDVNCINDLSFNRYRDYLTRFNPSHRYTKLTKAELLQKLQILIDDKLTYAGLLMFGKNDFIQKVFTDFRIDLLEIPGISYSNAKTRYTYRLEEQENLWEYYFALFERLYMRIDIPFKMGAEGFAVENSPPLEAIREALVNMLMHTDYFSPAKPRIRIFSNKIEFANPGTLPLSIENLLKTDTSMPRNPILAKTFRTVKLAENAGFGFDKMIDGWKSYKGVSPEFYADITSTILTFNLQNINERVNDTVNDTVNDRQKDIIKEIIKNKYITLIQLANKLNVSRLTIFRNIQKLKEKQILERIGSDKTGYWEIIKD